jgi:hypothetical protein
MMIRMRREKLSASIRQRRQYSSPPSPPLIFRAITYPLSKTMSLKLITEIIVSLLVALLSDVSVREGYFLSPLHPPFRSFSCLYRLLPSRIVIETEAPDRSTSLQILSLRTLIHLVDKPARNASICWSAAKRACSQGTPGQLYLE